QVVIAIALIAAGGTLLFNRSFVMLWAGEEYYLGSKLNLLIALAFCQIALLRCDAQVLDATLNVRCRAIMGASVSVIAVVGAVAAFRFTAQIEASYLALLGARLILNVTYARNAA